MNLLINTNKKMDARADDIAQQETAEKRDKEKAPYDKFVRINTTWESQKALFSLLDNLEAKIFFFFLMNTNWDNSISVKVDELAEFFGVTNRAVKKSIKDLRERGYLTSERVGGVNKYIINPGISWSSWNSNMEKCKFPYGVVIDKKKEYTNKPHIIRS